MKQKLKLLLLFGLLISTLISVLVLWQESNKKLTVAFLDIGQGDAIFIESPSGAQVLIDGGSGRSVLRELGSVMPFYDKSIDVVLATHPDADHIGGLPDVFENYNVALFLESGVESNTDMYKTLKAQVGKEGAKVIEARRGMVLDLGGGVRLEILFPIFDPSDLLTNTASIVARLVYGENEFLLTGDSPKEIENYLITLSDIESDVLKVGHHGSKTSTSPDFVTIVSPKYAVISAGKDNRYGHPAPEVIEILQKSGTQILGTYDLGTIIFESDGVDLEIK